ncbi:hypothetical protein ASC77_17020 [Nocardioides sp. Root1257]|uniref:hypothetical protein n=1 Tax=unclassified Nocardioides TaxID=2615069 RepID=UPI0006F43568|nr:MULTISPECIES: hypothetical protein [unclassified Nocardioides]KQW46902.1 hypothetical protein ASC77_17020 [Nocardioides sp. Root1257]KRC43649.1 hypothetical protein ASE24_17975 [Nocardioides sp. Root224]
MGLDGRALGSLVGLVGGEVFVQVNADGLPGEAIVRALGLALGALVVISLTRYLRSSPVAPPPPSRAGLRLYGIAVTALVISIPLGAAALRALGRDDLTPVWVVLVLGLHFVPFARAFRQPFFTPLAVALVAVALVGGAATLAGLDDGPAWTAVVSGLTLLVSASLGLLPRRRA